MPREVLTSAKKNHATKASLLETISYKQFLDPYHVSIERNDFWRFETSVSTQNGDMISVCIRIELKGENVKKRGKSFFNTPKID